MNPLIQILEARKTLTEAINAVLDDTDQSISNKVAAIIHGESSGNRKRALIEGLMIEHGLVPLNARVHAKHGALLASQVSVNAHKNPQYVAALVDDTFRLVKFSAAAARKIGYCCHGTVHKSDAYRASVEKIGETVYEGTVTYE